MKEMMKDSGIEWIGVIPEEWEVHPLYFYFFERNNKNLLEKEKNLLSLSYGRIIRKDIETWEGLLPENFKNYNTIEKDDIVIRPTDLQNDQRSLRTGIARERGIITSVYISLAKKRALVPSYFHYLLHSYDLCKVFYEMGGGVRQALRYAELSKLPALEPPLTEQQAIAAFLDDACAKIDGIIADLEHQVDLLKDYKKSLITETVTKGLDKHVKLKDSGITWIGEIPEHSGITKIKYSTELRNEQEFYNKTSKFIALENVSNYSGKYIETDSEYDEERYDVYKKGDLLFSKLRPYLAKALIASDDGYCTGEFAIIKKFNGDIRYLFFYLLSDGCLSIINASTYGAKMPRANWDYISNLCIPIINFTEQQAIADFLDTRCAEVDSIIKGKEEQIEQQKEYKKSLIYEYVTGKKRVKEVE